MIEVTFFDASTRKVAMNSISREYRICVAASDILRIATRVAYWSVRLMTPSTLFVEYRLVQKHQVICCKAAKAPSIRLPKVIITINGERS